MIEEKIHVEEKLFNYSILDLVKIVFKENIVELFKNNVNENINHQIVGGWSLLHLCVYQYDYIVHDNKENDLSELFFIGEMKQNYLRSVKLKKIGLKTLTIKLLEHHDININLQDDQGRTPIYFAGDDWLIKELIKRGAEINPKNDHVSPLHVISSLRNKSILPLITNNADLIKLDQFGRNPLHCAAAKSSLENVLCLLLYSPPIVLNTYDNFGHTPLSYAIMFNDEAAINVILKCCLEYCDINILLKFIEDLNTGKLFIPQSNQEMSELSEKLHIYDLIYNVDPLFKLYFGGAPKKGKNSIRDNLKKEIEEKQKNLENSGQIFKHGDTVYYLHPDEHGQKHTKFSDKIKKLHEMGKPPATFYQKFSYSYNDTLKRVIIAYAKSGGNITLVQFEELVGVDQNQSKKMEQTNMIELYYNGIIGSHIRPKATSWLTKDDEYIDIKESEKSNQNSDEPEKTKEIEFTPSIYEKEINATIPKKFEVTSQFFLSNNLLKNEDIFNQFKKLFACFDPEIAETKHLEKEEALLVKLKLNVDEETLTKLSKVINQAFENKKGYKCEFKNGLLKFYFFKNKTSDLFQKIENTMKKFSQTNDKIFN